MWRPIMKNKQLLKPHLSLSTLLCKKRKDRATKHPSISPDLPLSLFVFLKKLSNFYSYFSERDNNLMTLKSLISISSFPSQSKQHFHTWNKPYPFFLKNKIEAIKNVIIHSFRAMQPNFETQSKIKGKKEEYTMVIPYSWRSVMVTRLACVWGVNIMRCRQAQQQTSSYLRFAAKINCCNGISYVSATSVRCVLYDVKTMIV